MARSVRKWMWRLQILTLVMAMTGLVLNVFCNPFSPNQVLQWACAPRIAQSDASRHDRCELIGSTNSSSEDLLSENDQDQTGGRSELDLPPEIDDTVAIRPRARLSAPSRLDINACLLKSCPPVCAFLSCAHSHYFRLADHRCVKPQLYPLIC